MIFETRVVLTRRFEKDFKKVPGFIQDKVRSWIEAVELKGIGEIMKKPGLHDEPLQGTRFGERSVRLNKAYRLIYRVIEDRVVIELLEVNKHEY